LPLTAGVLLAAALNAARVWIAVLLNHEGGAVGWAPAKLMLWLCKRPQHP
jgi:hypothetical protein